MRILLALLAILVLPALGEPVSQDAQRLLEAARAQLASGQYPEAIRLARQSAQAFRTPGDLKNAGNALTVAGTAETYAGDYEAALRDMESALALARQTGDKASEVTRLNNIGNIFYFQGKYGEGLATLRTAMAIVEAHPAESWNAARSQLTTANIAVVYHRLGQSQLALDAYLDLRARHGSLTLPEQAQLLTNMGALYRRLGDPLKALAAYSDAEALYARRNLRNGELGAAINRGIALALDLRRYPEALGLFEHALHAAQASGDKSLALQATLYRAETLSRMGRAKDAERGFATAAAQAAELKAGEEQWKALYGLDLGVVKTHSRPHVSDDNPFSEAHFKTMKYRPGYPGRFRSIQDARRFCQDFFPWYNHQHHHSGLQLLTPATVHYGQAAQLISKRQTVLDCAYLNHPERFVRRPPQHPSLPDAVWINPPAPNKENTR